MGYGMALRSSHGIVWPGKHCMVYGIGWRASHGIWLWPGRQGMGFRSHVQLLFTLGRDKEIVNL